MSERRQFGQVVNFANDPRCCGDNFHYDELDKHTLVRILVLKCLTNCKSTGHPWKTKKNWDKIKKKMS